MWLYTIQIYTQEAEKNKNKNNKGLKHIKIGKETICIKVVEQYERGKVNTESVLARIQTKDPGRQKAEVLNTKQLCCP